MGEIEREWGWGERDRADGTRARWACEPLECPDGLFIPHLPPPSKVRRRRVTLMNTMVRRWVRQRQFQRTCAMLRKIQRQLRAHLARRHRLAAALTAMKTRHAFAFFRALTLRRQRRDAGMRRALLAYCRRRIASRYWRRRFHASAFLAGAFVRRCRRWLRWRRACQAEEAGEKSERAAMRGEEIRSIAVHQRLLADVAKERQVRLYRSLSDPYITPSLTPT